MRPTASLFTRRARAGRMRWSPQQIEELNRSFAAEEPGEIVRWVLEDSELERVAVWSTFGLAGTCLVHLAVGVRPDVPILFLDTGFHFGETLVLKERLRESWWLNVVEIEPDLTADEQDRLLGPRLYERDPMRCCELNKEIPLARALSGYDAWMAAPGDWAPQRPGAPVVSTTRLPDGRGLVRFDPLSKWTPRVAWAYLRENGLPHNPLYDLGYRHLDCAPCTAMLPDPPTPPCAWMGPLLERGEADPPYTP